ncbi:unnamed protein product [Rotaria sordida]|uniref:Protein-S-isoprenylcysteine O-methyltransferase n=1 Tax=Rotaria sordida TaxID=392033 RepID=A0A814K9K3_9BILA|nr:unnamed protein product [Rotaria sordida]CAF1406894.1 unnamed protein product [Rotaria sordida]
MDSDKFLCALFGIPCCLMEIYISKTKYSSSTSSKTSSKDRRTFIFIWLFIICSLLFSIRCARLGYGSKIIDNKSFIYYLWILFNISLYLMGILLRKQSIEQLGKWFTTVIRIDENQQIIDFGWYEKMRHPSYAVFFYRIHIEEQELKKHFGIKYEEYRQKVPYIIIPKVF